MKTKNLHHFSHFYSSHSIPVEKNLHGMHPEKKFYLNLRNRFFNSISSIENFKKSGF